ncbi:Alpha/beta hydrolase fold-1 [Lentinula lateritia]|uniref:Alpha/beta hydrolase fold-1 n=1 Tax=Lentinula lateritia TaxID=40482 RepID=A0ABQ8VWT1_9AGAR|nr:Alpha/beta hydrolase fold-1 [Lentinula lateritia]
MSLQSRAPVPLDLLLSESYIFDPRPHYPLLSTLKRLWNPSWTDSTSPDGLTLLFTHGTGFHKEQWEPTIDYLLELIRVSTASNSAQRRPSLNCRNNDIKIREIWTIDAPNHGDAGVLNEKSLRNGYEPAFPKWQEYAHNIHAFLTGRGQTLLGTYLKSDSEDDRTVIPNFDFSNHTIVCIGHSIGAISLLLSLDLAPSIESHINISSMIFIEPMTMPPTLASFQDLAEKLASGSRSRRDVWPSAEEAYKMFKTRRTWRSWDDRVLKIFVDTGLRPLPTLNYPNTQHGTGTPVTLKCTREQETATYRETHGWDRIYRNLPSYASRVRIHIYYGKIHDFIAKECKENVINTAAGGPQNFASTGFIDGAGHTAPQQKPRGVAEKIFEAIEADTKDRLKGDSFQAKI